MSYYPGHWYMDAEDDVPPDRCPGTDDHGCGRFLVIGAWLCARCEREARDIQHAEAAQHAAADAADAARLAATQTALGAWTPLQATDPRDLPF